VLCCPRWASTVGMATSTGVGGVLRAVSVAWGRVRWSAETAHAHWGLAGGGGVEENRGRGFWQSDGVGLLLPPRVQLGNDKGKSLPRFFRAAGREGERARQIFAPRSVLHGGKEGKRERHGARVCMAKIQV
jgi:hypothetical protein